MIHVLVERYSDRSIAAFTISGHADAGPYGKDIVCAGVSAVSIGAINAVSALCNYHLDLDVGDEKGGYLRCIVPPSTSKRTAEDVQLLLEGMLVSLRSIEEEYGDHLRIIDDKAR